MVFCCESLRTQWSESPFAAGRRLGTEEEIMHSM